MKTLIFVLLTFAACGTEPAPKVVSKQPAPVGEIKGVYEVVKTYRGRCKDKPGASEIWRIDERHFVGPHVNEYIVRYPDDRRHYLRNTASPAVYVLDDRDATVYFSYDDAGVLRFQTTVSYNGCAQIIYGIRLDGPPLPPSSKGDFELEAREETEATIYLTS